MKTLASKPGFGGYFEAEGLVGKRLLAAVCEQYSTWTRQTALECVIAKALGMR
jgi:hypothetical protein